MEKLLQNMYKLIDFVNKKPVKPKDLVFAGTKNPWEVVMNLDDVRSKINVDYFRREPAYVAKYLPFLPVKNHSTFVSLSEGSTPLVRSKCIGRNLGIKLYFKYEGQNPTGSFKDRGSAVDLSVAHELKGKAVAVASTGNMAASVACYSAAAGIPCFVFVPEGTPAGKLAQVISYGGKIVQVKGTYNDAAKLAQEVAEKLGFYLAGDYAFRVEGQKTAAFEIIDQLFYREPDAVVIPMGCGTNIAAYKKGFAEYKYLGFIEKIPQIMGVQAEGACSIVNSFQKKKKDIEPLQKIDTIASAIAVTYPLDGVKALEAVYSTKGQAISVTDREILEAQYMLAREEGLFAESSSASALAGIIKLAKNSNSLDGKKVVCVLTGNGLKDPGPILKVAIKPPTIYPEVESFLSLYRGDFFEGKNVSFFEKDTVLFSNSPSEQEINKISQQIFEAKLSDNYLKEVKKKIVEFLKKGKKVTFADFQDILQDVLENATHESKKVFKVEDFYVTTGKDKVPKAQVVVKYNSKTFIADATGVGPVDAVINALKKANFEKIKFALTDYRVEIRNRGTDAVVSVNLTLTCNGNISVGQGTSPDIIQASIEAFEHAYNGL